MNRSTYRALTLCAVSLLAVTWAAPALADEASQARELFQAAQRLYKANKFAEAIAKFEEALAAKPHPVIHFNIARCYEQLGEPAKALRSYRDYLRLAPDAKDRDAVTTTAAGLEKKLAAKGLQQLLVLAEPDGARVEVDGKDLGRAPASVELVAGEHKVRVTADGFDPSERTINFTTARATEQSFKLVAHSEPPPPPPPLVDAPKKDSQVSLTPKNSGTGATGVAQADQGQKKGRLFTWVAAGVAVASAGAGLGMTFAGNGQFATLHNTDTRSGAENEALIASGKGLYTGSYIAYGVAGAAAITAVILFFLEGK